MTDYSTLSDDELDVEIARRRGLNVHTSAENGGDKDLFGGREHIHGEWVDIWLADERGYPDEPCPSWSRDMNAASELLRDMEIHYLMYAPILHWHVSSYTPTGLLYYGSFDTPSRAIAEAYCHYTDTHLTPAMLAAQAAR